MGYSNDAKKLAWETLFSLVYNSEATVPTNIALSSHQVMYFKVTPNNGIKRVELDIVVENCYE